MLQCCKAMWTMGASSHVFVTQWVHPAMCSLHNGGWYLIVSRHMCGRSQYCNGKPRWCALLPRSFGVLMWEVYCMGAQPFANLTPYQVTRCCAGHGWV